MCEVGVCEVGVCEVGVCEHRGVASSEFHVVHGLRGSGEQIVEVDHVLLVEADRHHREPQALHLPAPGGRPNRERRTVDCVTQHDGEATATAAGDVEQFPQRSRLMMVCSRHHDDGLPGLTSDATCPELRGTSVPDRRGRRAERRRGHVDGLVEIASALGIVVPEVHRRVEIMSDQPERLTYGRGGQRSSDRTEDRIGTAV